MDKPSSSSKPPPKSKKSTPSRKAADGDAYTPGRTYSKRPPTPTPKPKATPSTRGKKTLSQSGSSASLASTSSGGARTSGAESGLETPVKKSKRKRQDSVTPTGPGAGEGGKGVDREKTVHADGGVGSATPRRLRKRESGVVVKGNGEEGSKGDGLFGDIKYWNVIYSQRANKQVIGYEIGLQPILPPGTLVDYTFTDYSSSSEDPLPFTSWLITHLLAEAHSNVYGAEAAVVSFEKMSRREWKMLVGLRGQVEGSGGEESAEVGAEGSAIAAARKGKAKEVIFQDGEDEVVEVVRIKIVPGYAIALKMRLHHDKQANFIQNDFDRCQDLLNERRANKDLPLPVAFAAKARILRPPGAKDGKAAVPELQSWEVGMMASGTRMGICAQDLIDWSMKRIREVRMQRGAAKEGTREDMDVTSGERAKIMAVASHTIRPFLEFNKKLKVHQDAKFANAIITQQPDGTIKMQLNDLGAWRKMVTKYTDEDAIVGTFGSCHVTIATRFVRKWLEDEGDELVKSGMWTQEEVDREKGEAGFAMAKQPGLEMDGWGLGTDILRVTMPARWVDDNLGVLERALTTMKTKMKNGSLTYAEFDELAKTIKEAYSNIYIHRTYENVPGFDQSSAILLKALIRHPTGTGWLHAQCSPEQLEQYHMKIEDMVQMYTDAATAPALEKIVEEYRSEVGDTVAGTGMTGVELAAKLAEVDRAVRTLPIKIVGHPGSLLATKNEKLRLEVCMFFDPETRIIDLVYPLSTIYGQYSVEVSIQVKCILPGCEFVADRWSGDKGIEDHLGTKLFAPKCPYLAEHADEEFTVRLLIGWRETLLAM